MREEDYPIARKGLATSFTESEQPIQFARKFRNRFINAAGGAEKRQGIVQLGDDVTGTPNLTGAHELVKKDGTTVLFVSGNGRVYAFDDASTYTQVHVFTISTGTIRSVQMGSKLIFWNGADRNVFTEDGATFEELRAINEAGTAGTDSDTTSLTDADVTDWTVLNVAENDLVYNRTQAAFGVVTAVASASVAHTTIGTAGLGIGEGTGDQASGDEYQIVDMAELNIIPTDGDSDNTATVNSDTSAAGIFVSAVADWTKTDIRIGDIVRNTTRTAVTEVTSISTAQIGVVGITGQTAGDSVVFMKSKMPITTNAHVHYGRLYLIDERDQTKVRISGENNPNDMTTNAGTLDSSSFIFGTQQPEGDVAVAMASYQRFFAIAGKKNLYMFQGTNPIADTSADSTDFIPVGLFPQGNKSKDSLISIGNDLAFVTPDGVQSASLAGDASTLARANLSEAIKVELRDQLKDANEDAVLAIHYPRRSWYLLKVGSKLYCYNYTVYMGKDPRQDVARIGEGEGGSWSLFDGGLANQNAFLVRQDGTLVCAGAGGKAYQFDQGTYSDDGTTVPTSYQTAWMTLTEPRARNIRVKSGHYLKPIFDAGTAIVYSIQAEAGFAGESGETITVTAQGTQSIGTAVVGATPIGGSPIQDTKYALRWRGEQLRMTFTTNDTAGPDTLSRFTMYVNDYGRR